MLFDLRQINKFESRGGVVGIATRLRDGRPGVRIPAGKIDFSLLQNRPERLFNQYWGFIPWVKRPGREVNHSPPYFPYISPWSGQEKLYIKAQNFSLRSFTRASPPPPVLFLFTNDLVMCLEL
jgi:hypothetical protein